MGVFKQKTIKHISKKGRLYMIKIIYNNEIIDTTNDINEALYLKKEYELAFHTTDIEIEINF